MTAQAKGAVGGGLRASDDLDVHSKSARMGKSKYRAAANASGEVMAGAQAKVDANIGAKPLDGNLGAGVKLDAFAGAQAEGTLKAGLERQSVKTGKYETVFKVGVQGAAQAGAGGKLDAHAGFKDGTFSLGFDAGAVLGTGGEGGLHLEINPRNVAKTAIDAGRGIANQSTHALHAAQKQAGHLKQLITK